MFAEFIFFISAFLSSLVFSDDKKVVFGNLSDNGKYFNVGDNIRFIAGISGIVARGDSCAGVAIK